MKKEILENEINLFITIKITYFGKTTSSGFEKYSIISYTNEHILPIKKKNLQRIPFPATNIKYIFLKKCY